MARSSWLFKAARGCIIVASTWGCLAAQAATITVTHTGSSNAGTCTLAQAILRANAANGVSAAATGSATPAGACTAGSSGSNTILLPPGQTITLSGIDNFWYGPNALPPIVSAIVISGQAPGTEIVASHVGDPTPTTANAFRFFYVSGGLAGQLPAGSLTLSNLSLQGGYAKGGDSNSGGGGAGMGGAIFNQGTLALTGVSLIGNTAQGGTTGVSGLGQGGGGMGADSTDRNGGGFGGALGGTYGGLGSLGSQNGAGGGGGGFVNTSVAGNFNNTQQNLFEGAFGGGPGGLGGHGGRSNSWFGGRAGDGGGGGSTSSGSPTTGARGGDFGSGGQGGSGSGGGGGVGGGGGAASSTSGYLGGGGGFGGGGGSSNGVLGITTGGFGGFGGGGAGPMSNSGFGGGNAMSAFASGAMPGAGMGGAIFNHAGTVSLINVTAHGNAARGGVRAPSDCRNCGSGLGAVLFNLNGQVTVEFSTFAGNLLSGVAVSPSATDGTLYSLAYGRNVSNGGSVGNPGAAVALLKIHNSIVTGTQASPSGFPNDVVAHNVWLADLPTSSSTLTLSGINFIQGVYTTYGASRSGATANLADPQLGAVGPNPGPNSVLPMVPIDTASPAYNAAPSCLLSDGSTVLTVDGRGATRPYADQCDIGAFEYTGAKIFANGYEG